MKGRNINNINLYYLLNLLLILLLTIFSPCVLAKNKINHYQQITRASIYQQKDIPVYQYKIIKSYPHSQAAYTEGLVMDNGVMYEGTGIYGHSALRAYDLETGKTLKLYRLKNKYFGEGVTLVNNKIIQLTYKSNIGFIYDRDNFKLLKKFYYPWQGWGLTYDFNHKNLIMSDGSAALIILDPNTFKIINYKIVNDGHRDVGFLNELEYINGIVYANIWQTSLIAMINPDTGKVIGWIDLHGINPDPKKLQYPYVLNGIAYDTKNKHLLVTGKHWPTIYAIDLVKSA